MARRSECVRANATIIQYRQQTAEGLLSTVCVTCFSKPLIQRQYRICSLTRFRAYSLRVGDDRTPTLQRIGL